ncbi:cytidine deaminase-like protein [Mytilinidion resinicola]|uniref:Cytidine deaminase-like protein n=1 Tax=Mytilinidion resinicola TaxID=574789 RepID=A0A6A6YTZ1_9PEZI|nr:cytidine deaminase-like protein [Mytilinidion resinicola]KAF2812240.1 cytidine deaminase-like protein [Mytilinidion resinicola]
MPLPLAPPSSTPLSNQHFNTSISSNDHPSYMRLALSYAHESRPLPTNFRVGALLVDSASNRILTSGYTLELPGNTHAEQCCLSKYAAEHNIPEERVGEVLPERAVIYTTVEPCVKRLSGNRSCVERIVETRSKGGGIRKVYVGVKEPETFVGDNQGRKILEDAGVEVVLVGGLEEEILRVATAGHVATS